ncbi:reverse transcriptase domain-containing protein [Sphingomonas sp.]|uniref:reverse transcriptase domain-containing protein n=1 Tax=Sphingomonas sp. TaxID=28214 RepID=UPI002FDB6ECA
MAELIGAGGIGLLVDVTRGVLPVGYVGVIQERAIVEAARRCTQSRIARVEEKLLKGAYRAARREADDLRRCLAGRFTALWSSLPHALKERRGMSAEDRSDQRFERWRVMRIALGEAGRLVQPARAKLFAKPKFSGFGGDPRYRMILTFDWIDQARQRLIRSSLSPFVDFHPSQHLLRHSADGRGRSAVLGALLRELPLMGRDHVFMQLDVQDFYPSISHAWLEENLPLAKGITRAQIHTGGMTIVPTGKNVRARLPGGAIEQLGQRGIPQGSALSALVGEYVVAEVLRGLADLPGGPLLHAYGHNLHTYSDNLGIFVDREQADAIVDLLQKAFASSAAGPFFLRAAPPRPISQPFKFLGYWFRLVDGAAEVFVPPEFAEHRADAILGDLMTADRAWLTKVRKRIEGVAGEWARWNGVDAWKRSALQRVATAEEALDAFELRGVRVPGTEVSSLRSTFGAHLRLQ